MTSSFFRFSGAGAVLALLTFSGASAATAGPASQHYVLAAGDYVSAGPGCATLGAPDVIPAGSPGLGGACFAIPADATSFAFSAVDDNAGAFTAINGGSPAEVGGYWSIDDTNGLQVAAGGYCAGAGPIALPAGSARLSISAGQLASATECNERAISTTGTITATFN